MNWKKKSDIVRFVLRHEAKILCENLSQEAKISQVDEVSISFCVVCHTEANGHHFSQGICPGCQDTREPAPQDGETAFYLALWANDLPF
jgi:hypothetical protein